MKKAFTIIIIFTLFFTSNSLAFAQDSSQNKNDNIIYSISNESIELSGSLALAGLSLYLRGTETWNNKPFIGGRTDLPFKEETVPSNYLFGAAFSSLLAVSLLPNNQGWLNHTSYANTKGLFQSFALNGFATVLSKRIFGRKRPDYQERLAKNIDLKDGSLSFFSGHASSSFNLATYLSLFLFEHLGDSSSVALLGKSLASLLLVSLATLVSYTRIIDNKHHIEDVIVGGLFGATSATLVYGLQNEWFFKIYQRDNNFSTTSTQNNNLVLYQLKF